MTYFDRIKNALLEVFVFLPLSAIIFALIWLPVGLFIGFFASGTEVDVSVWIFMPILAIICFGIAFLICRVRMKMRGYPIDIMHANFWNSESTDIYGNSHFDGGDENPTPAGVFAVLSAFIALPLGLVAAIASVLGLIYPEICTYPGIAEVPDTTKTNKILHALFDFIIEPTGYENPRNPSPLGLLNLLSPALAVGIVFGSMWIATMTGTLYTLPEWAEIVLLLISLLALLTFVISAIIDTVLLCRSFTPEQAKDNVERALVLLVIFSAAFVPMIFAI